MISSSRLPFTLPHCFLLPFPPLDLILYKLNFSHPPGLHIPPLQDCPNSYSDLPRPLCKIPPAECLYSRGIPKGFIKNGKGHNGIFHSDCKGRRPSCVICDLDIPFTRGISIVWSTNERKRNNQKMFWVEIFG